MAGKPWRSKDYLEDRYVDKRMTIDEIARECKDNGYSVTPMTIWNNLKSFDLIKNSRNLGKRSVGGNSKKKKGFYG